MKRLSTLANDITPHLPQRRPLVWTDAVLDLQETLLALDAPPVYIVGGAVRDAFLHRPIKDVDLATASDAIKLARRLADRLNGDIFVMDRERDVARVFLDRPDGKLNIDVTHFRGEDLLADLTGRDFTVNAMAVDLLDDLALLIDPLNGEKDLEDKVLRRCADDAIASDPIRALRAVRQSIQLNLRIEPETREDIRREGVRLTETSPERVRDEFINLLALEKPAAALRVADALGLLHAVIPEVAPLHGLEQAPPHVFDAWQHTLMVVEKLAAIVNSIGYSRTDSTAAVFDLGMMVMQFDRYRTSLNQHIEHKWANERPHRSILMLGALLHNVGKGVAAEAENDALKSVELAEARLDALRLSNPERTRIIGMIKFYRAILEHENWSVLDQHRYWHNQGEDGHDVLLMALADYLGTVGSEIDQHVWLRLVDNVRTLLAARYDLYDLIVKPPTLLNGTDLMEQLNIEAGPVIRKLLDAIREAQVVGEVVTAEDALGLARRYLAEHGV